MTLSSRPDPHLRIRSPAAIAILLMLWMTMTWLSYPRPNLWLLAYVAPLPLALLAVRGARTGQIAAWVYPAGVAWALVAVMWLRDVTLPGWLAISAYLGLYPLLFVMLLRLLSQRLHVPMTLLLPVVWVAVEYLRGLMITGFPWFGLGHSQPTTMIQIADLAGAYGVSFIVAMTAGLLLDLLTQPLFSRRGSLGKTVKLGLIVWLCAMSLAIGYGRWRIAQFDSGGASIRVAVVQTDVPQSNKTDPTPQQDEADFSALLSLTQRAAADSPDLIVWPETTTPLGLNDETIDAARRYARQLADPGVSGPADPEVLEAMRYWAPAVEYRQRVERAAGDSGGWLIAGSHAVVNWQSTKLERYNSAFLISPDPGAPGLLDRYDKVHRVPFGEYLPMMGVLNPIVKWFSPYDYEYALAAGSGFNLLEIELASPNAGSPTVWLAGTPICFEDVVSYVCRKMIYAGGQKRGHLLVNLTNDGWYPGSAQGPQHEQIARFRCVENRVPMARAVNRGVSGFIDSLGRIVGRVQQDGRTQMVAGVATAELFADVRRTLFGRVGDLFAALCGCAVGAMMILCILTTGKRA